MAQKSEIEWTDTTWNSLNGCTKIGTGCYAERFANRRSCRSLTPFPCIAHRRQQ